MKSFSTQQDSNQISPEKNPESWKRQWIILALFIIAVISLGAFFILRVVLERVP